jgi:bzd-type benzoyl-CoA reductase N subunit
MESKRDMPLPASGHGRAGTRSELLETLAGAARTPLAEWPAGYPGYRAMGYLCSYVPEEMLHAAGFTPVRVRGNDTPLRRVDAHLQSFTCALCRSTLDQVLGKELAFLAGTVFAHTCDAMQAQADLVRMNTDRSHWVETVMQPANLGTPAARPYLLAELERFRRRLADFAGRPLSNDDLRASIALYDETRRLMARLQEFRGQLAAAQFFAVTDAAQMMPREEFNPLLAELLRSLAAENNHPHHTSPRLFLTGAVLDEPRLLALLDGMGASVVGDDLCSGSRHFYGRVGTEGDPVTALADYYLSRPPCPTKLHPDHDPARHLVGQARAVQAQGIVFVIEKFCEPHAFDYALIRPTLEETGIPHLLLEMEHTPSLEGLRTRLQAFVEIL